MATAEKTNAAETETAAEENAKQAIHEKVQDLVRQLSGSKNVNIGRAGGKKVFDLCVAEIFKAATRDGNFRFPAGFGALHVRKLNEGTKPKRLPNGTETTIPAGRVKLRYVEGNEVKSLMGTKKEAKPKAAATA